MPSLKMLAVLSLLLATTNVGADSLYEDDSYTNYDSIVAELKASAEEPRPAPPTDDLHWDEVAIHGGLGLMATHLHITTPGGEVASGLLKGIEGHFGVNLFTRKARAEGAFRNYIHDDLSSFMAADLKEFELRVVYTPMLMDKLSLRLGAGVSARYLNVSVRSQEKLGVATPATSLMFGLERKVSPNMAFGPDVSYRSAMISDTIDKSAWDASLRLNATF